MWRSRVGQNQHEKKKKPIMVFSKVSAKYGVAAGGDLSARDIIIKYGLAEDEIGALMRELHAQDSAAVQKVAELSARLGITDNALTNFFRILGEQEPAIPEEKLLETLADIAERHRLLLEQAKTLRSEDPAIQALREQATAAIDQGWYDEAERLLSEAETKELAAAKGFQAAAAQRLRNAAATRAERGELSLVRLNYLDAALHFK
jgi:vacuolar-type H+-ATPase subunit I/STV1